MSSIEDFEEVDFSEEYNITSINTARAKSKIKNKSNKSKIPMLDSTCIDSNTYDYEKLMSLISPKRIKDSCDIDSKRFNALATPKRNAFSYQKGFFIINSFQIIKFVSNE